MRKGGGGSKIAQLSLFDQLQNWFGGAQTEIKGRRYGNPENRLFRGWSQRFRGFLQGGAFLWCNLYLPDIAKAEFSQRQRRLRQLWHTAERLLRQMQRAEAMCSGSQYPLRRRCGKPHCRCRQGQLHATWVVTRSERG